MEDVGSASLGKRLETWKRRVVGVEGLMEGNGEQKEGQTEEWTDEVAGVGAATTDKNGSC